MHHRPFRLLLAVVRGEPRGTGAGDRAGWDGGEVGVSNFHIDAAS